MKVRNLAFEKYSKKTEEDVKAVLLWSIQVTSVEDDVALNKGEQAASFDEAMRVIARYKKVIRTQTKKIFGLDAWVNPEKIQRKQKKCFETVGLNKFTIYLKINIYKFVKKYPRLIRSTLPV